MKTTIPSKRTFLLINSSGESCAEQKSHSKNNSKAVEFLNTHHKVETHRKFRWVSSAFYMCFGFCLIFLKISHVGWGLGGAQSLAAARRDTLRAPLPSICIQTNLFYYLLLESFWERGRGNLFCKKGFPVDFSYKLFKKRSMRRRASKMCSVE